MTKCIKAALLMLISVLWVGCDKDEPIDKVEIIKMYVSAETGTYTPRCVRACFGRHIHFNYLNFVNRFVFVTTYP